MSRSSRIIAAAGLLAGAALSQEGPASTIFHRKTGYGLRISVELKRDGLVRTVSPNFAFRTGDQIRLHFTSNFDGYVYALNEAPNGRILVIFPSQETGSNNLIRNAQDYVIPATKGWFRMKGESGEERVHMVISPRSLPELGKLGDTAETVHDDSPSSPARAQEAPVQTSGVQSAAGPSVVTPPGAAPSRASAESPAEEKVRNGAPGVPNVPSVPKDPQVPSVRTQVPSLPSGTSNPVDRAQKKVEKKVGKVRSGIALGEEIRRLPGDIIRIIPGLRSKDLVLQDDMQERASYVTTLPTLQGALGDPVTFTIVLVH